MTDTIVDKNATPQFHVAICMPTQDQVHASFAMDLAKMVRYTTTIANVRMSLAMCKGTVISSSRNLLVRQALEAGATHILWLDADMRFPEDTVARLLAHGEPIVAAYYSTRRPPAVPTVALANGDYLVLTKESKGLIEIARCGMGVMLTATQVFRDMAKPYFAFGYNRADDSTAGEDVYFCVNARKRGYKVLIDADLSKEVVHLGEYPYAWDGPLSTLTPAPPTT